MTQNVCFNRQNSMTTMQGKRCAIPNLCSSIALVKTKMRFSKAHFILYLKLNYNYDSQLIKHKNKTNTEIPKKVVN